MRWQERAACRNSDPTLFDSRLDRIRQDMETQYDRGVRHGQAIEHCARCPVAQECLDALAEGDEGVRGGYLIEIEDEQI